MFSQNWNNWNLINLINSVFLAADCYNKITPNFHQWYKNSQIYFYIRYYAFLFLVNFIIYLLNESQTKTFTDCLFHQLYYPHNFFFAICCIIYNDNYIQSNIFNIYKKLRKSDSILRLIEKFFFPKNIFWKNFFERKDTRYLWLFNVTCGLNTPS